MMINEAGVQATERREAALILKLRGKKGIPAGTKLALSFLSSVLILHHSGEENHSLFSLQRWCSVLAKPAAASFLYIFSKCAKVTKQENRFDSSGVLLQRNQTHTRVPSKLLIHK